MSPADGFGQLSVREAALLLFFALRVGSEGTAGLYLGTGWLQGTQTGGTLCPLLTACSSEVAEALPAPRCRVSSWPVSLPHPSGSFLFLGCHKPA